MFVLNDRHPTEQQYHRGRNLSRSLTTHRRQSCQMPSGCQQVGQLTQPMASQRKQWWIKAQFKSGFTHLHKHNSVASNTYGLIVITLFDSEETVYSIPLWHSRLPKILPHFGSKTNIFRLFVVIVFKHAPVIHIPSVSHVVLKKAQTTTCLHSKMLKQHADIFQGQWVTSCPPNMRCFLLSVWKTVQVRRGTRKWKQRVFWKLLCLIHPQGSTKVQILRGYVTSNGVKGLCCWKSLKAGSFSIIVLMNVSKSLTTGFLRLLKVFCSLLYT